MAKKSTIKLLLINESENESERLISLFRDAGRVARATRAQSAEELFHMLEQESWDLLIANDKHPEIVVDQCLELLKKNHTVIPSIVIRDGDANAALDAGACDVITSDDDQRLIYAALRELRSFDDRRQLMSTKEKLSNAIKRCDLLMAESPEALAYAADGMLISSNDLFCTHFGYANPDELDCTPVIDLMAPSDSGKFKQVLKALENSTESAVDFEFIGQKQNGTTFTATMHLSDSVFDDEPCIQLTISESKKQKTSATSATGPLLGSGSQPSIASLASNHEELSTKLTELIAQADDGLPCSALAFISIDGIGDIRHRVGITQAGYILASATEFIRAKLLPVNAYLTQYCDGGLIALLEGARVDSVLKLMEQLCADIEKHIIEVDGQSIQCTASIGLVVISGKQSANSAKLIDSAFSACEIIRQDGGSGVMQFIIKKEKQSLGNAASDQELDQFLEEALSNDQFSLSYQPIVSLRGTSGEHYEVRTTMIDDDGDTLDTSQFSDNVRFSTINTRLDRWVILAATEKLALQIEQEQDVRLFINLSASSLQDESLIPWLDVVIKDGGVPPAALIFQFSASDISDYLKPAINFLAFARKLGCKISIAEFGQATDPFKVLKHIQADYAKISESFTEQLQPGGDAQILKAMVSSIGENNIQAVIGDVKNAAALAKLWQLGVDYIQGSYLAEPSRTMDYEFTDIA